MATKIDRAAGGAEPILSGTGVRRSFPVGEQEIEILHGVDLELHAGERLSLMGTSGAGKTTLLNILALLDRPSEGKVLVAGESGWDLAPAERARLRNARIGFATLSLLEQEDRILGLE